MLPVHGRGESLVSQRIFEDKRRGQVDIRGFNGMRPLNGAGFVFEEVARACAPVFGRLHGRTMQAQFALLLRLTAGFARRPALGAFVAQTLGRKNIWFSALFETADTWASRTCGSGDKHRDVP